MRECRQGAAGARWRASLACGTRTAIPTRVRRHVVRSAGCENLQSSRPAPATSVARSAVAWYPEAIPDSAGPGQASVAALDLVCLAAEWSAVSAAAPAWWGLAIGSVSRASFSVRVLADRQSVCSSARRPCGNLDNHGHRCRAAAAARRTASACAFASSRSKKRTPSTRLAPAAVAASMTSSIVITSFSVTRTTLRTS